MQTFFTHHNEAGYAVIEFITESLMNPVELETIGHSLYRVVDEGSHRVLLDFTKVQYLSSQAVGIILTLSKKVSQHKDGELTLCGVGPKLMQLLKITRLDKILRIKGSKHDVLK